MSMTRQGRLAELAWVFLKLGLLGFGGPAAHLALFDEELVERRGWLERQELVDLIGLANLIPGPNSTEVALHVGLRRAGWRGLLVAGACFIGPAAVLSTLLAGIYARYGALPSVRPALAGIEAAMLALVLVAGFRLARSAVRDWRLGVVAVAVAALANGGMSEVVALLGGGVVGMIWLVGRRQGAAALGRGLALVPTLTAEPGNGGRVVAGAAAAVTAGAATTGATAAGLGPLAWVFLKIGATLYGSGYVLVSFLEDELVRQRGWLTPAQLVDAVAAGHATPGPLLSTAAFAGYLVAGLPGSAVATVAIFGPAFVFVSLLSPLATRLRSSTSLAAFVEAVSAGAVGLLAVVAWRLGAATLTSWPLWLIGAAALAATLRSLSMAWLVPAAALLGWLAGLAGLLAPATFGA
jgi:chromate transporter